MASYGEPQNSNTHLLQIPDRNGGGLASTCSMPHYQYSDIGGEDPSQDPSGKPLRLPLRILGLQVQDGFADEVSSPPISLIDNKPCCKWKRGHLHFRQEFGEVV
ncbi:hypothetical protein ACLOJK_028628 [Asimina triloba]